MSKKPDLKYDKKIKSSATFVAKGGDPKNSSRKISKLNSKTMIMKDDQDKEASSADKKLVETPSTGSKKKELKAEKRPTFTAKTMNTPLTPIKVPSELKKDQKHESTVELRSRSGLFEIAGALQGSSSQNRGHTNSRVDPNQVESLDETPLDFVYDGDKNKRA